MRRGGGAPRRFFRRNFRGGRGGMRRPRSEDGGQSAGNNDSGTGGGVSEGEGGGHGEGGQGQRGPRPRYRRRLPRTNRMPRYQSEGGDKKVSFIKKPFIRKVTISKYFVIKLFQNFNFK